MIVSLNGIWKLEDSRGDFKLEVEVPGDVFSALIDKGLMPHPYVGRNELLFRELEERDWIYRKVFRVEDTHVENVELVFEGVDTVADVYLNGVHLGRCEDMFLEYRFDVKGVLRPGENEILVKIASPVKHAITLERNFGKLKPREFIPRMYIRKAQYSFGWDWGPRLPSAGIWKGVHLELFDGGRLWGSTAYITDVDGPIHLTGYVESLTGDLRDYKVLVSVDGRDIGEFPLRRIGEKKAKFEGLVEEHLSLWYPLGVGEPSLHDFEFRLVEDEKVLGEEKKRIGLRTVDIIRERDEDGESFIFSINGERVFVKGANWIPVDTLTGWMRDEDYEELISMAENANVNMLRVWGGGIYEKEIFYRLCDEKGIMVWQDFMFSCAEYPDHLEWFRNLANEEARQNVIKLRHHPSIVLWCGNNENNWGFEEWDFVNVFNGMHLGDRLYLHDFPKICSEEDPSRPYWPSSPYGGERANSENAGDTHVWHVWSGWKDYREYENVGGRFISEFGFQSAPAPQTIEFFTKEDGIFTEDMLHHNKQIEGMERLMKFINSEFGVVGKLEDVVHLSQFIQAEAIKYGVEHWRSRKYKTAGVIYWQWNDVWPVFSWSAVDYFKRGKALYHYTRKIYSDVLPLVSRGEIYVVNDMREDLKGELRVELWKSTGEMIWSEDFEVRVPKDGVLRISRLPEGGDLVYLRLSGEGIEVENHKILKKLREMKLRECGLRWKVEGAGITFEVDVPCLGVWIRGCEVSDNFLTLFPNHPRKIHCKNPDSLNVKSINDIEKLL